MNEDKIIENFKVYCRIRPLLSQEKEQTIAVKAQSDVCVKLFNLRVSCRYNTEMKRLTLS